MLKVAKLIHPVDKELHIRYLHNFFLELMKLKDWESGYVEKREV